MFSSSISADEDDLKRLQYHRADLAVDLGVGLWAWPMPMDFDSDGDLDLVVSCPDVPYNGIYLFENPGGEEKMPVFRAPKRLGPALRNCQVSYVDGRPRVLTPAGEHVDFLGDSFEKTQTIGAKPWKIGSGRTRAKQWKYVDYEGDGDLDLIFGVGYWGDYGWDDAFDDQGNWTRGPLHGYVYLIENVGTSKNPEYADHVPVTAGGEPVDVYGMPSPNFADFDGDGDLDLICGEFLDGFTYFRNKGTRSEPEYAAGVRLLCDGEPITMNVQMITPTALDWDGDGDVDLVVGDEDGRVALVENTGKIANRLPLFLPPNYFQQEAADLKFGALVTPVGFDWDDDGDEDLVCGNTAGHIAWLENLGGNPPRWEPPRLLKAGGEILRIQAGPRGSIQGPCEAKWGYTTLSIADWDGDQLPDLVVNSIWGKVVWYRNLGTRNKPRFEAARPVRVDWNGIPPKPAWNWWDPAPNELATQWRTTPVATDWNEDGLCDLIMLDHEGYLAFFERIEKADKRILLPGKRIFVDAEGHPLRLNPREAGKSGRRKLCLVDFDRDGKIDLLANSKNADFFKNMGEKDGKIILANQGPVAERKLAGHTTSPTTVDFDRNGIPDLVIGAEDGRFYFMENPNE